MFEQAAVKARAVVDPAVSAPLFGLTDEQVRAGLQAGFRLIQAATAMTARLVREADGRGLPAGDGTASLKRWLTMTLLASSYEAGKLVELGEVLDARPGVAAGVAAGRVTAEQARMIADALDALPRGTGPHVVAKAEQMLVGFAEQLPPAQLRAAGSRILAHVDPDAADRAEHEATERRNNHAHRKRTLALTEVGDGRTRLTGWLDPEAAATVRAVLDPLCKPLPADDRTPGQRRADALVEVCRLALGTEALPDNGGDRPQLTVTVGYDVLRRELGQGVLDTGETLTAAQVRRLACDARILPAVLDTTGMPLDVGRTQRLVTAPLRRALILRDKGCAFPGCDRPARWTHCHHMVQWSHGGPTCLDNLVLLCSFHHRLIHHSGWEVRLGHDRRPEFLPPPHLDPRRRPRRNTYHQRR